MSQATAAAINAATAAKKPTATAASKPGVAAATSTQGARRTAASKDDEPESTAAAAAVAAAARASAQAMALDPALRRGHVSDVGALLDSSAASNAAATSTLRQAQLDLKTRVAGLHSKVAREEQQHRLAEGVPKSRMAAAGAGAGIKPAVTGKSKAKSASEYERELMEASSASAAAAGSSSKSRGSRSSAYDDEDGDMRDLVGDDEFESEMDRGLGGDSFADEDDERIGGGAAAAGRRTGGGAAAAAADDFHDADDTIFAKEEIEYARLLAKERSRRAKTEAQRSKARSETQLEKDAHLARINTVEWILSHTREQSLGEVRILYLGNQRLHALPSVLAGMTALKSLDLNANHLRSLFLPSASGQSQYPLSALTELRELKAQHNSLHSPLPSFRSHPHLQTLKLDYNNLEEVGQCCSENHKLQTLSISSNRLSFLGPGSIAASSLTSLDLTNNALSSLAFLPSLVNLREAFLGSNAFTGSIPNLSKLLQLDELSLEHNRIESMDGMGLCGRLTTLNLSHNRIKKITGVVVVPAAAPAASPGSKDDEKKHAAGSAAAKAKPAGGLVNSLAAAARADAEANAALLARSKEPVPAAAANQKSFACFPMLTDLLLRGNLVADLRADASFERSYPRLETLDLRDNQLALPLDTLLDRFGKTKASLVDLKLGGNPALNGIVSTPPPLPSAAAAGGAAAAAFAAKCAPCSPVEAAYRKTVAAACPALEVLDEREVEGRDSEDENGTDSGGTAAEQANSNSRPSTASGGNSTPRGGPGGLYSSRPSTAAGSRPSTAGFSRPGTASGRPGTASGKARPLMRPPSALKRAQAPSTSATPSAAADVLNLVDPDAEEAAASSSALEQLGSKMDTTVRETAAQLAGFKKRFQELMAASAKAIEKRGLAPKISARNTAHKQVDPPAVTAPAASPNGLKLAPADLERAHSLDNDQTAAAAPSTPPRPSRDLDGSSRPGTAGGGSAVRPGSADRRGATTPRQRLEQAKMFSHHVYGSPAPAAERQDESRYDELTGELLPASLTKPRAGSASYKPQHSKPSFQAPSHPLPSLSGAGSAPPTPSPEQQHQQQASSKPSTPSTRVPSSIGTTGARAAAAANQKKPATPTGGGLFDSPFLSMKPVPSKAESAAAAAKTATTAASKPALARTLPSTRAVPIAVGAASPARAMQPSVSANRPSVPAASLGVMGRGVGAASGAVAAAPSRSAAPTGTPGSALHIRQRLLAEQLAAAASKPPEELSLDDAEDAETDERRAEARAAGEDPIDDGIDSDDAEDAGQEDDETSANLFARPWSAHARAEHSALNSARSRPQSAARTRPPHEYAEDGVSAAADAGQDAVYTSFSIPIHNPALQAQLQNQIQVSSAYKQAFAATSASAAAAHRTEGSMAGMRGHGHAGGGQTPRGTLPVSQNPFLLKNTVYSGAR